MPNWCSTQYVAEGPEEQLKALFDTMNKVASMPAPGLVENDFGSSWLGNLVAALGVDPFAQKNFRCRGQFYDVDLAPDGKSLSFGTMTAWCEADDTRHLIEEKFPGVHLIYISEEFGCGFWETNDIDRKYFTDEYYLVIDDMDGKCYDEHYLSSLESVLEVIKNATGLTGMKNCNECEEALEKYQEEHDGFEYTLMPISYNAEDLFD